MNNLSMGGPDNLRTSVGHNWQEVPINAPPVLKSSLNLPSSGTDGPRISMMVGGAFEHSDV
jgi:cytochrome c peroxidase